MSDWIAGTMIQRYVEERFSTYTKLMNLALEMSEDLTEDDRVIAKFSNFIAFSDNIQSEVENIFKVKVIVDKQDFQSCDEPHSMIYHTRIKYNKIYVGNFGFSIDLNLLKKYQEGCNYDKLN